MTPDIEVVVRKKDKADFEEQFYILIDELALYLNADSKMIKDLGVLDTKLHKNTADIQFWYAGRPRFTIKIKETWRTLSYAVYKHYNGLIN